MATAEPPTRVTPETAPPSPPRDSDGGGGRGCRSGCGGCLLTLALAGLLVIGGHWLPAVQAAAAVHTLAALSAGW